jgi:pseudouridine synthase
VGRIDDRSRGLLLMSNDLDWNTRVAQNQQLERRYEVVVSGVVSNVELDVVRAGLSIPGLGPFRPRRLSILSADAERTRVAVAVFGGHHRQVRAVFTMLRHEVLSAVTVGLGPIDLDRLQPGAIRELTPDEICQLGEPRRRE